MIDRSDAVNLARNISESEYGLANLTPVGIHNLAKAVLAMDEYIRSSEAEQRDAERYRWLRDRMVFCNTHPGGRPVLYDTSARLWYHATDDLQTETLEAAIDTAMSAQSNTEESK